MAFTNIPPDIVLPAGATLGMGSGAVYIGGPQMPAEMIAQGYLVGLLFFTGPGEVNGVEYWFIALSNDGSPISSFVRGMKLVGTATPTVFEFEGRSLGLANSDWSAQVNQLLFRADSSVQIESFASNPVIAGLNGVRFQSASQPFNESAVAYNLGTKPVIGAASTSTTIDVWQQQVNSIVIGGSTVTRTVEWIQTIDYIVDMRIKITTAGATLPGGTSFAWNVTNAPAPNVSDPFNLDLQGIARVVDFPSTGIWWCPVSLGNAAGVCNIAINFSGSLIGPNLSSAFFQFSYSAIKP